MFKFINSKVNRKLTAMCIILAVLICIGCCVAGYYQYRNSAYKSYNDFAYEIGEMAMAHVDGDRITSYLDPEYRDPSTGEFVPDEEYSLMAEELFSMYRNTSMHTYNCGIYICVPFIDSDGGYKLTNLFDVRIVEAAPEVKSAYDVGVVDSMGVENPAEVMKIFETGERSEDYFVHESKFGYNSTAILPVKNSSSETVALLMADMPMPYVAKSLNSFLQNIILVTLLVIILFMAAFLHLISRRITKPLKLIAEEADAFTESDISLSKVLPEITQTDEIGQLAASIYRMEGDIQNYVENLTAVTAEKERIGAELDVAREIQASMLPNVFPKAPHNKYYDIYATMNPAKEVGGDFYDFFMVDSRHVAIVMADVSGKGVPAALFMVIGKTLIKDHTLADTGLDDIFNTVNDLLYESNSQEMFITAFEGVLDLVTGEFRYVNAGHEKPFIRHPDGKFEPFNTSSGFVLAGLDSVKYKAGTMFLEPGSRVFQYTDGITEATNADNELFGMERLEKALNEDSSAEARKVLETVDRRIGEFVKDAPQFDDITMLVLDYKQAMPESGMI